MSFEFNCSSQLPFMIIADKEDIWNLVAQSLNVKRLAKENIIKSDDYRSPNVQMLLGVDSWVSTVNNGIKYAYLVVVYYSLSPQFLYCF
jgi:hypothetical protein